MASNGRGGVGGCGGELICECKQTSGGDCGGFANQLVFKQAALSQEGNKS
jgi:hypothetical protein